VKVAAATAVVKAAAVVSAAPTVPVPVAVAVVTAATAAAAATDLHPLKDSRPGFSGPFVFQGLLWRCLRGCRRSKRSNSGLGSRRSKLATIPIGHGITRKRAPASMA